MRRRRVNKGRPRQKRTLIPAFDPEDLARSIEQESSRATVAPPFDPANYARIVERHMLIGKDVRSLPTVVPPAEDVLKNRRERLEARKAHLEAPSSSMVTVRAPIAHVYSSEPPARDDSSAFGREMYGAYLRSDFPAALRLAERVLEGTPDHALALMVVERCRERLDASARELTASSVLRLRHGELDKAEQLDPTSSFILGHVDGVSDAATIATLTGLPRPEALDRLHALLDLGVVELVSA